MIDDSAEICAAIHEYEFVDGTGEGVHPQGKGLEEQGVVQGCWWHWETQVLPYLLAGAACL